MEIINSSIGVKVTDKYVFFYSNKCPLSNFYPTSFTYSYQTDTSSHRFFTSEQAFMWSKARFFDDNETAEKILMENLSPMNCKNLGRSVKNYDDTEWDKVRFDFMKEVNYAKFSQNEELKNYILQNDFYLKLFVEASPSDGIWGIRMKSTDDGLEDCRNWRGQNLLGKVLSSVRDNIELDIKGINYRF